MTWTNKTNPSGFEQDFSMHFQCFWKIQYFFWSTLVFTGTYFVQNSNKCLSGSLFLHDLIYRKKLLKRQNYFRYFLLKVNFEWWRHRWFKSDVKTLDWWRQSQKGVIKCYEQRISITWNENRRYKTMTTDYSYLYNQIFLVFIHPKITCQLPMTNDWELDRGVKMSSNFQKTCKNKLGSLKNRGGPQAHLNFSQ